MPSVTEFSREVKLPVSELSKLAESQVTNPNSAVYQSILSQLSEKFNAVRLQRAEERTKKKPHRVYIQHAVSSEDRYRLVSAFPAWELKFSSTDKRAAPAAHAIFTLMSEYLVTQLPDKMRGDLLVYGISLKQIIMRNRTWMHACVPGHWVEKQAEFLRDDRAILAMSQGLSRRGKESQLAREYAEGTCTQYCCSPGACERQAEAGVAMFHRTDTNFRQIAYYMRKHGLRLFFFAVPASKHLEFCTEGEIPELGAYVFPDKSKKSVNIVYKGDTTLEFTYTHQNYMELVARTQVILGDFCYHKEFVVNKLGVTVYKVTSFPAEQASKDLPVYRSWNDPSFSEHYLMYVPVLRPGGAVASRSDWIMHTFPARKSVVDDVIGLAMRADGVKDIAKVIERSLFSQGSTVLTYGSIVPRNSYMISNHFELIALVIFTHVFMKKFTQGQAVSTLAPQARALAQLSREPIWGVASAFVVLKFKRLFPGTDSFEALLRRYSASFDKDVLQMPHFRAAPGFTEYSQTSENPMFAGWDLGEPTDGFSDELPGVRPYKLSFPAEHTEDMTEAVASTTESAGGAVEYAATGAAYIDEAGQAVFDPDYVAEPPDYGGTDLFGSRPTLFAQFLARDADSEDTLSDDESDFSLPMPRPLLSTLQYPDVQRQDVQYVETVQQRKRAENHAPDIDSLVSRVLHDTSHLHSLAGQELRADRGFNVGELPPIVLGQVSDVPKIDLQDGLNKAFPGTSTLNTSNFESDKHYGPMEVHIRGAKIKIDLSRIVPLKPERIFPPAVRSHVQPDTKNTLVNTLLTVEKRNANTPSNADPLSEAIVFDRSWSSYLRVFCIPDAEKILESLPYIGPTEESIRWMVSALTPEKRERLNSDPEGFTFPELVGGITNSQFMLKPKLKPELTHSYADAGKLPQSIQYDGSGRSTPVFTPMYSQKVDREQSILKHNVMIMQRKNIADVNRFLNQFDWRPNARGNRYYIEADYNHFDKSQAAMASGLHWRKCAKFGFLPDYLKFFRDNIDERTVSALKAGIKMWLRWQRASGYPYTLDGNNDVNELAIAEFLERIIDLIEFVVMMGDDSIVAVRAFHPPDISGWEGEIKRKYNLSIKIAIHTHGYICSMDIVHYPDGHSRVIPDVIKRALMLTQQSMKDEELFEERFVSYADNMDGIQDVRVQRYLAHALPERYKYTLPTVDSVAITLLCKVHAKLRDDFAAFRSMYSSEYVTRFS